MDPSLPSDDRYRLRLVAEKGRYEDCLEVHDLPPVFHYWSNKYLRPKLESFGFSDPRGMFLKYVQDLHQMRHGEALRFASIGAGNCELEISLARSLLLQGRSDFVIDCLELNPAMLERGKAAAVKAGVDPQIRLVETDANLWTPDHAYDAVFANQSLHHILSLEHLFGQINHCLKPDGIFIISDMIGRNGHLRWPEALEIVQEFWQKLPPSYRVNRKLQRFEERFENWDCSTEDFEGIRSQDILPLLSATFHFRLFVGFGNVIDPFVDRAFGPHFNIKVPWDRAFIDSVHERDEREMLAGNIKPTHMLAVLGKHADGPVQCHPPLSPAFCIRHTGNIVGDVSDTQPQRGAYEWQGEPHDAHRELELACRRLAVAEQHVRQLTEYATSLRAELAICAERIPVLADEIAQLTAWARRLDSQLTERTAWASRLNSELTEELARAEQLEKTLEERTAWALGLDRELAERTQWALQLKGETERLRSQQPRGGPGVRRLKAWLGN